MPSGIVRCPYCNKDFGDFSEVFVEKHMARCQLRLNPYIYSERGRGRPSNKERMRALKEMGRL